MCRGIAVPDWVKGDPDVEERDAMSGTITRIGSIGAGALLAIGLFAAPPAGAEPSERSGRGQGPQTAACFDETGKTQGRSHSDPDGMENGGFDKPGCTGGHDADRDGNNGCGNDADREDDNNGHCGRGRGGDGPSPDSSLDATTTAPATDDDEISAASAGNESSPTGTAAATDPTGSGPTAGDSTDVAVGSAGTDDADAAGDPSDTVGTEVLGETMERPSALPRTGAGVGGLALLGGLLCGGGRVAVLARRLLRIG